MKRGSDMAVLIIWISTSCVSFTKSWPNTFLSLLSPQDLGLQGTSLNDILYKNAAFLNLVDPISHELLLGLARDLQCPKRVRIQNDPVYFNCYIHELWKTIYTDFTLINRTRTTTVNRGETSCDMSMLAMLAMPKCMCHICCHASVTIMKCQFS